MKILFTIALVLSVMICKAQHERDIRFGYNFILLNNNTFDKPSNFVKGKLSTGHGVSILYRQTFNNKFGWQTGLNYSRHTKTFSINYPLSNFDSSYSSNEIFEDNWSIKGFYQNADFSLGLFYKTRINKIQFSLSADLGFDLSTFMQRSVEYSASYTNPNPMIYSSTIVNAYGEPGIVRGTLLVQSFPKYRFSAGLNYPITERIGVFFNLVYEKITPNFITNDGSTEGFYPISFRFYQNGGALADEARYVDKFNYLRTQLGITYNLNYDNLKKRAKYGNY